ncbi:MAG: hypothetical protein WDM91_00090 [Rhizomicrobium sp.]
MFKNKTAAAGALMLLMTGAAQAQFFNSGTAVDGSASMSVVQGSNTMVGIGVAEQVSGIDSSVTDGSHVRGSFAGRTVTGSETTVALGAGALARTVQASVNDASTGGNVSLTAESGDVTTVALGGGASACTSIASVNRSTAGSFRSTVVTGGVLNVGIGTFWPGRVTLGSLGRAC